MKKSIVKLAAKEYKNGNFFAALDYYRQASELLGEKNFRANINLCEKKLINVIRPKNSASTSLQKIRIAAVMDEFTHASYKDTCNLLNLSFDNWEEELNQFKPDILFIESAWRGKDNAWDRKISQASKELIGALDWCNARNIATMFWNKEDPIHYSTFLNTAKRFDFVFTTDINCIGNYKRDLGHDRVYVLPFACNPIEHNPIEKYQRKSCACFAGSYYVRYPERIKDLDTLLETFVGHSGVDIYDRQFGKQDANYAFPDKYLPLILGNLKYNQIDVAYKGYEYGINLNSVKYSPTMFARRVYELLASNTLVISNYSKGIRLQFGNLVVSSDAKTEISSKIFHLEAKPLYAEKIKLAGLRKVMTEHTYEDRFSYIIGKVLGGPAQATLPLINVVAVASTSSDLNQIIDNFRRQKYDNKKLSILVSSSNIIVNNNMRENEQIIENYLLSNSWMSFSVSDYVAKFHSNHYYGGNYLIDLAIATRYTSASVIAKGTFYCGLSDGAVEKRSIGGEYSYGTSFYYESALVTGRSIFDLLTSLANGDNDILIEKNHDTGIFFVDKFNYINATKFTWVLSKTVFDLVEDLPGLDSGLDMLSILCRAEIIPASSNPTIKSNGRNFPTNQELFKLLNVKSALIKGIECTLEGAVLKINAHPECESPYYIYTNKTYPIETCWPDRSGNVYLESSPGLEISPVVVFFDESNNKIGHRIMVSNWNQTAQVPLNATSMRFGVRVTGGPGEVKIKWYFDHVTESHRSTWLNGTKTLIIAPHYPRYDDYYRYAFVHRRVKGYRDLGMKTDVFRFQSSSDVELYEYEDVDVISGGADVLNTVLTFGDYSTIAIHALDESLWDLISTHLAKRKIVIWLHGAEIQSWKRRMFNNRNQQDIDKASANGERRDRLWRSVFSHKHPNLQFVFVSNYFCQEVISDLAIGYLPSNINIIHNPIDTNLFEYVRKNPDQRKKILSIRPYASRVYANDLMVKAIVELSMRSCFCELLFLIVGDGVLFDETVAPLRQFNNVEIRKGFLSQEQIAAMHRDYGIFLCPSRMDTQGVSRDEAMASGLVPITNNVGAISEFCDVASGFLCEPENYKGLADAVETLYFNSLLFERMSAAAATNVRSNRKSDVICQNEMSLFVNESSN